MLIQPGSLLQIISAFIIVLVYMLLIGIAQPFKDVGDVTTPHVGRGGKVACPQTAAPVVAQVPKKKRKKEKTDCVLYHTMDKKIRINSKAKKDKRDVDNRFSVLFYLMDKDYVIYPQPIHGESGYLWQGRIWRSCPARASAQPAPRQRAPWSPEPVSL